MGWRRAAIATCATVAVLAGAVTAVAAAVAGDQASARLGDAAGASLETREGPSSAYRSSVTISLDGSTESCLSFPSADRAGQRTAASCRAVVLPVGASEQDVLGTLGEPQGRRPLSEGSEAWDYRRYLDDQRYAFASITVTFTRHRLAHSQEYIFK